MAFFKGMVSLRGPSIFAGEGGDCQAPLLINRPALSLLRGPARQQHPSGLISIRAFSHRDCHEAFPVSPQASYKYK